MSDVQTWSSTAASNNSAAPNGFPEGMPPSGVNDAAREVMAAVARYRADTDGVNTSSGTDTITLSASRTMTAYAQGDMYTFKAGGTNTGATTLNVDSLGAKDVQFNGAACAGGEIVSGLMYTVVYDGTQFQLLNAASYPAIDITNLEVTNIKAKDGTASASIADSTGIFTHSTATVFPAGTASAPAITTTGDTNTGLFFPAADTIAFTEGGAEAMRIDSSGNVGIGTTSPGAKLAVAGGTVRLVTDGNRSAVYGINRGDTGHVNGMASIGLSGAGANGNLGQITFSTAASDFFDAALVERMRIDSSGNVGIGTSSPGAKLDVVTTSSDPALSVTQLGAGNAILIEDSTRPDATPFVVNAVGDVITGSTISYAGCTTHGTNTDVKLQMHGFSSSDVNINAFSWDSNPVFSGGVVGLKSNSGTRGVHTAVTSGSRMAAFAGAGSDGTNFIRSAWIAMDVDGAVAADSVPGAIKFITMAPAGTTSSERMRVSSSGDVGIGTNSPACKLDVDGQIAGKYAAVGTNTAAQALATNKVSSVTISADTTLTTTVPPAGATACVIIVTSGSTSRTVTFGTGFASTGTLATGATASRRFVVSFVSDGTRLLETARTTAITV